MTDDDLRFLRVALDACRRGIEAGQDPFGAAVVIDGALVAEGHNRVDADRDPTAHGEVVVLRDVAKRMNKVDFASGREATLYSSCEPCPMCLTATATAGIRRIVFAATVDDAADAGFTIMQISNAQLRALDPGAPESTGGHLREEAVKLFDLWKRQNGK